MTVFATALRPPAQRSALATGVASAVATIELFVNAGAVSRFGWDRPGALLLGLGVSFDLLLTAVVLGAISLTLSRRPRRPDASTDPVTIVVDRNGREVTETLPRPSLMATLGLVLVVMVIALWCVLSGSPILFAALAASMPNYTDAVGGAVLFGLPWVLGTVFSAAGLHQRGDRRNRLIALTGLSLGLGLGAVLACLGVARALGALG